MALAIPSFSATELRSLIACAWIDASADELEAVSHSRAYSKTTTSGGAEVYVTARISVESGSVHVHVDVVRADRIPPPPSSWDEVELEVVIGHIMALANKPNTSIKLDATYDIPQQDVPDDGFIDSLLGMWTHSSDLAIEMQGSRFAIRDDRFLREVRWDYIPPLEEETGEFAVTITGWKHEPITETYLTDALSLLQRGLDRFVLEKTDDQEQPNDEHESDSDAKQAEA